MAITRDEVKEIAELARLSLSDEEVTRFTGQLGSILEHIDALSALDTTGIEPTTHAVPMDCPLREDVAGAALPAERALAAAPVRSGDFFEVPKFVSGS
ncbi:MAG: Asp-tRNA(Asn)/Glu-tRNA(Gln) amidotransferase subunit GatC [Deltaproteobacteria bacterium]|nr:Asp-tRNA(Asn)/Glu-tRNA(Gln) amidotransferase subunit GatC [Deltaproteobacteria bacterium]